MGSQHSTRSDSTTEVLEILGRLSLRNLSMENLLQTIADLARSVMPGDPEASVTLLLRDTPSTVASTARLAVDLDETQYECGHGPCLHTARTGAPTEIADTQTESRWPDYVRRAVERGTRGSLSVPLVMDGQEQVRGSLNIYARQPRAFDHASRAVAARFATYAAVAADNLHAYQGARDLAHNLQRALESRAVIDQAKGILIERHKVTGDRAFQLLVQVSMRLNVKVRDVSDHLVRTGELPVTRPRRG
jgi:GAF domain-containing protein